MLRHTSNHTQANRKRAGRAGEVGFSILETSIALVLMTVAALGAASLFYYSIKNTTAAGERDLAMAVAQQKMEQLRSLDFTDAGLAASAGTTPVTVTRAGQRYQIYTSIVDGNVINGTATSKTITVRAAPVSDMTRWSNSITSYFGSVTLVDRRCAYTMGPNRAL